MGDPAPQPTIAELDALDGEACRVALAPLFEGAPRFLARLCADRPFGDAARLFERARAIARAMPEAEQLELIDAHPRLGAPPGSVSALSFVEQGYARDAVASGHAAPADKPAAGPAAPAAGVVSADEGTAAAAGAPAAADATATGQGAAHGAVVSADAEPAAGLEPIDVAGELERLNAAYEAKFGFRYCVFVAGRPRAALLPEFGAALHAGREAEIERALDAVVAIAADRYRKAGEASPSPPDARPDGGR